MKLVLIFSFLLLSTSLTQAQTFENIEKGIKKATHQIMALIPKSIDIEEGYKAKVNVEWPNGKEVKANETLDVLVKYDSGNGKPFKLILGLDSQGNISATIHELLQIFGINWKFGGTLEFDSNGVLQTSKYYYNRLKSSIASFWR